MTQELIPRSTVLEVLDAYTDHIASPNECVLLREIRTELLRIPANLENAQLRSLFQDFLDWHDGTEGVDSLSFQTLVAKLRANLQS